MSKSLEELLKQKKMTGDDVGQIYLYATANDIISSRQNEPAKNIVSQETFNRIAKKVLYLNKEKNKYKFYLTLDTMLTDIEKTCRYYDQSFWRYLTSSMIILNQISDHIELKRKVESLNISQEEKNSLLSNVLTVDRLVNSDEIMPSKYFRSLLYNCYINIKMDLSFFYSLNFVYREVFKHINFENLDSVLVDVSQYENAITTLNKQFNVVTVNEDLNIQNKFKLYFNTIDCSICKPFDEDNEIVKAGLNFTEDFHETFLEGMEDMILNLGNTNFIKSGGDSLYVKK